MRIKLVVLTVIFFFGFTLLPNSLNAESPYIVKKGSVVEELILSNVDVNIYGYVKTLNLDSGDVKIFKEGKVDDLRVGAGDVEIYGEAKDIEVGIGKVTVYGRVRGDIKVGLGSVILKSNSIVEGDIAVVGKVKREEGSIVKGDVEILNLPNLAFLKDIMKYKVSTPKSPTSKLITFFVLLFVLFLILALFPNATKRGIDYLSTKPLNSFLLSLILIALAIGISILLIVTIVGIILVPLLAIGAIALYLFGSTIFYTTIGKQMLKLINVEDPNLAISFLVSAVPLLLIEVFVPYGEIISLVPLVFGFGAGFKAIFPKLTIFNL